MGHGDVKTTEIYTHVLKRGAHGVRSPFSGLNLAGATDLLIPTGQTLFRLAKDSGR
nr:hypothetical protein [Candidatus Thiodiazotropha sp. CDECU1]